MQSISAREGLDRVGLLSYIEVCRISFQKLYTKNLQSGEKASWARVIVSAVAAGGPLIRDKELSQLKVEVSDLRRIIEGRF